MFGRKFRVLPLLMLCFMLLCLCAACGDAFSGAYDTENMYVDKTAAYEPDYPVVSPGFAAESPSIADGGTDYAYKRDEENSSIANTMADKIIYTAYMNIETTEFDSAVQQIEKLLADYGGFIASSEITGSSRYNSDGSVSVVNRYGYYTLRVPSLRYNAFLHEAGSLGNMISKREGAENITARYQDREARKLSLETQEKRLLELLAKAEEIDDIIALESKLAEVRYEIESIESQLRNWQSQVDYSTVNITLCEVAKYTPTVPVQRSFWERFRDAIHGSWENFVDGSQNFLIGFIYALPALLILAVIVLVVWLIVRKALRYYRAKAADMEAAEAEKRAERKREKAKKKAEAAEQAEAGDNKAE